MKTSFHRKVALRTASGSTHSKTELHPHEYLENYTVLDLYIQEDGVLLYTHTYTKHHFLPYRQYRRTISI